LQQNIPFSTKFVNNRHNFLQLAKNSPKIFATEKIIAIKIVEFTLEKQNFQKFCNFFVGNFLNALKIN